MNGRNTLLMLHLYLLFQRYNKIYKNDFEKKKKEEPVT